MTHCAWLELRLRSALLACALLGAACHGGAHGPAQDVEPALPGVVHSAAGAAASAQALRTAPLPVARVVVVGDSISEGLGARRPELSYAGLLVRNDDARYPEQAGQDLTHRYGPALRYVNIAHAGDTSAMVLSDQLPRLSASPLDDDASLGHTPLRGRTVVFLTIGGNDVRSVMVGDADYQGAVLESTLANLHKIFAYFADPARFPDGVSLYFASVYDVTDGTDAAHDCLLGMVFPGITTGLDAWNTAYRELAKESHGATLQVHLLDALSLFHGHGFHYANAANRYFQAQDASLWLSDRDCIHPNHRGHHELRRAFWGLFNAEPPLPL